MTVTAARKSYAATLLAITGGLALLIGLWAARQFVPTPGPLPKLAAGTALPSPRPLAPFTLTDHHGRVFNPARLKGAWTVLFFGYTHCPDVCPTTLTTLNSVVKKIAAAGADGAPLHVVFISVDPQRDSVPRLAEYVPYFNKDFLGVTGSAAQLDGLTSQLNILHIQNRAATPGGDYTVDHTASLLLIDPQARFSAIFSPPHVAAAIAQDFLALRRYYQGSQ